MALKTKIDPGEPLDVDIYELSPEELAKVPKAPATLQEALSNLERDHDFLTAGGVFPEDFIYNWVSLKMDTEVKPLSKLPHPLEFEMYYDC